MSVAQDPRDHRLVIEFAHDALESLREFELGLVKLRNGTAPPPVVDHLFRIIHSVKGNAGFFGGFQAVRRLAHAMEEILAGLRGRGGAAGPGDDGLLTEGAQLLGQALRARLPGAPADPAAAVAAEAAYVDRVQQHRSQPAVLPEAPAAANQGATGAGLERAATIKIEAAGLAAFGRDVLAVRDGLAELARTVPGARPLHERVTGLARALAELRTVPLGKVFDRLPAMVGALAESLGKSVAVETAGGELPVDRAQIDLLEGALVHLLRNALDHGIERQDIRARRGKPAVGRLAVRAQQAGGRLLLQVEDDGAGIDPKRLRMEAVVRKLMSEAEAAALSDMDAIALIFRPGFSTAPATTDVSGRGVGMDAVQTSVRQAGGEVRIQSTPRKGTTIVLDLPVDLPDPPA
jgi:two-component system, chemotaxis family, sensor kinase CheA